MAYDPRSQRDPAHRSMPMPERLAVDLVTPEGASISGPHFREGRYCVDITDPLSGESITKQFTHSTQAIGYIDGAVYGTRRQAHLYAPGRKGGTFANHQSSQLGSVNRPLFDEHGNPVNGEARRNTARINLRPVREVLEDYGLDPTVELALVLLKKRPVMVDGKQALGPPDPETGEMEPLEEHVLPETVRAQLLVELQQYVSPKLRAVEMKVEDKTPPTEQQVDQRIAAILSKHPELASVVAAHIDAAKGAK